MAANLSAGISIARALVRSSGTTWVLAPSALARKPGEARFSRSMPPESTSLESSAVWPSASHAT